MKLLITGVPGTGKTTLGDYLAKQKGFLHKDMEEDDFAAARELEKNPQAFIQSLAQHQDVVLTWGFGPFQKRYLVELLRQDGFKLFWLDGDRIASFRTYMHREKHDDSAEYEYYGQMREIIATDIVNRLQPTLINPFTDQGDFRPIATIAREVLGQTNNKPPHRSPDNAR